MNDPPFDDSESRHIVVAVLNWRIIEMEMRTMLLRWALLFQHTSALLDRRA
jgi:hypothetical protein